MPLLIAAGVAGLGGWMLQQRSTHSDPISKQTLDAQQVSAAKTAEVKRQEPAGEAQPTKFRTIDLDEEGDTRAVTAADESMADTQAAFAPTQPAESARSEAETLANPEPTPGPEPSQESAAQDQATAASEAASTAEPSDPSGEPAVEKPQLPPFDTNVARSVLSASASKASSCRRGEDPRGTAEVLITFAPSGRVTSANVNGEPFGGTATGGCIASTMRQATVPAFTGDHVTVRKLVKVH